MKCTDALVIAELTRSLDYRVDGLRYIPFCDLPDGRVVPQAYIVTSPNMTVIYDLTLDLKVVRNVISIPISLCPYLLAGGCSC